MEFHVLNAPNQNGDLHNCIENEWHWSVVSASLRIECWKVSRLVGMSSSVVHAEYNYQMDFSFISDTDEATRHQQSDNNPMIKLNATDKCCWRYSMPLNYYTNGDTMQCVRHHGNGQSLENAINYLYLWMQLSWMIERMSIESRAEIFQYFACTGAARPSFDRFFYCFTSDYDDGIQQLSLSLNIHQLLLLTRRNKRTHELDGYGNSMRRKPIHKMFI